MEKILKYTDYKIVNAIWLQKRWVEVGKCYKYEDEFYLYSYAEYLSICGFSEDEIKPIHVKKNELQYLRDDELGRNVMGRLNYDVNSMFFQMQFRKENRYNKKPEVREKESIDAIFDKHGLLICGILLLLILIYFKIKK